MFKDSSVWSPRRSNNTSAGFVRSCALRAAKATKDAKIPMHRLGGGVAEGDYQLSQRVETFASLVSAIKQETEVEHLHKLWDPFADP